MGTDYFEKKKDCGCVVIEWSDDWCRGGSYVKDYCEKCMKDKNNYISEYKKEYEKNTNEYKINPSNELLEKIITLQKENKYKSHEIYCPCCNKIVQYNNIGRHTKSLEHIKKLPIKNEELLLKKIKFNSKIKIDRLYLSRKITKEEYVEKLKEL